MVQSITLQKPSETDIVNNDILGQICFAAPNEGTGTDAILIAASMFARSEGDFAADNNATELVFTTGASASAAPGATNYDMTLSSTGTLTLAGGLVIADGGSVGGTLTVGVDDTGHDVKFFGATSGSYMLWDESADDLIVRVGDIIVQDGSGNTEIAMDSSGTLVLGVNGDRQIRVDNQSGTNTAGNNLDMRAGKGTGNATGGSVKLYTSPAGNSGSGTNAHAVAVEIDGEGTVEFKKATYHPIANAEEEPENDATLDFDLRKANYFDVELNANITDIDFKYGAIGQRFMIRFEQDASSGPYTIAWNAVTMDFDGGGSAVAVTVSWPGGTAPTMTATDDKADTYGFVVRAEGHMDGFVIGQNIPVADN